MSTHTQEQVVTATTTSFDREHPPALTVRSGAVVTFDCPGPGLPPHATVEDVLATIDFTAPHSIAGPVAVEGARPGDAIAIDVLDLTFPLPYGHTLVAPGVGLLPDEFGAPYVESFAFVDGHAQLTDGVRVALEPFLGIMGLAPAAPGPHSTIPPRRVGGNIDIRDLTVGARLLLPVEVEGGLFSCGDGHGAQGDGEVCVTAIETAMVATLRLTLVRDRPLAMPQFVAPARRVPRGTLGWIGVTSIGEDLLRCCREAVSGLIGELVADRGLTREQAYVLCSIAADLRVNEAVNAPNHVVSAQLPLDVFAD